MKVPPALKICFVIHFTVDMIVAIPLFIFPIEFLELLGWHSIDPFATRLVAAALFGIGIESFLSRDAKAETYMNMLNLKLIWSGTAIIGVAFSIYQSLDKVIIAERFLLVTFLAFHLLWLYWKVRVERILKPEPNRDR